MELRSSIRSPVNGHNMSNGYGGLRVSLPVHTNLNNLNNINQTNGYNTMLLTSPKSSGLQLQSQNNSIITQQYSRTLESEQNQSLL